MSRGHHLAFAGLAARIALGVLGALHGALSSPAADTVAARPLCVSVRDFGARGDGVADDTAAVQQALDSGRRACFPQGTWLVQMNCLVLPDGACLTGAGRLSRIRSTEISEAQVAIFKAIGRTSITIESLCFETPRSTPSALLLVSCSDVTVTRCRAVNCQLVYVGSSAVSALHDIGSANAFFDIYDHVTSPAHYSRNIAIEGNECVGNRFSAATGMSAVVSEGVQHLLFQNNSLATSVPRPEGPSGLNLLATTPAAERYLVAGNLISGRGTRNTLVRPETLLQSDNEAQEE